MAEESILLEPGAINVKEGKWFDPSKWQLAKLENVRGPEGKRVVRIRFWKRVDTAKVTGVESPA